MKIKQFIKKNKVKMIVVGTIVGGAVIGGVIGKKHSSGKTLEQLIPLNDDTRFNKEELIDFISKAEVDDKFAIFKENNSWYEKVEL